MKKILSFLWRWVLLLIPFLLTAFVTFDFVVDLVLSGKIGEDVAFPVLFIVLFIFLMISIVISALDVKRAYSQQARTKFLLRLFTMYIVLTGLGSFLFFYTVYNKTLCRGVYNLFESVGLAKFAVEIGYYVCFRH